MSTHHEVFVERAEGVSHDQLVADVEAACGVPLLPSGNEFDDRYAGFDRTKVWLAFSHEFEEDKGIPFERYDSYLDVKDVDGDLVRQEAAARRFYDALAATGRYRLALVLDVQRLILATDLPRA
ncbi:hypothetical protein ACFVUH_29335 [Kitasatospora sp. NPDC058032]|uniref:hypothetical protein n=1 Tax=Kitasatospora sp. NPDC058032 TaxID=3346307 RepID=UPI0036D947F1